MCACKKPRGKTFVSAGTLFQRALNCSACPKTKKKMYGLAKSTLFLREKVILDLLKLALVSPNYGAKGMIASVSMVVYTANIHGLIKRDMQTNLIPQNSLSFSKSYWM